MVQINMNKSYEHFNRELGKQINSKRQYKEELKRRGLVSQDKGDQMAKDAKERQHRDYKPSDETKRFFSEINSKKSKDGQIKLSGRELAYMKKVGVDFRRPEYKGLEGGMT